MLPSATLRRRLLPNGMVEIEFHLVDFMDARPLPRASVEFTLTVVPRFPVLPDDGPGPPQPPRPDDRLAESLRRTVETDADGRAALSFDATDIFSRLTGLERDDPPGHSVDAVGTLSASARLLGIRLPRAQLAGGLGPAERLEHTLPADLGMSIVGHTTPETARLWFHLPFEPASDHSFTCHVAPARAGVPAPAAGPVDPATDLGPAFDAGVRRGVEHRRRQAPPASRPAARRTTRSCSSGGRAASCSRAAASARRRPVRATWRSRSAPATSRSSPARPTIRAPRRCAASSSGSVSTTATTRSCCC